MPIFRTIFNRDQFRHQYVDGRQVKRHYAFVNCDECDRLKEGFYPDYSQEYGVVFIKPAYWLETKNGKVRACYGFVSVSVMRGWVRLNHEAVLKLGGGLRSRRVNQTPYERHRNLTNDQERRIEIFTHLRSHMNERELDRVSREWGDIPEGAEGWWYYNPQYAAHHPQVIERLRLGGDDENNVII